MSAHDDPLARAYIAAQAVRDLDRAVRGAKVCGCGKEYMPTPDGRRRHQMVFEHRPVHAEDGTP